MSFWIPTNRSPWAVIYLGPKGWTFDATYRLRRSARARSRSLANATGHRTRVVRAMVPTG